jgi:hypothetical protein
MKQLFLFVCVACFGCISCGSSVSQNESSSTPQQQGNQQQQQTVKPKNTPAADICQQYQNLCITAPTHNAVVSPSPTIKGIVADPEADVWVIVHPTKVGGFWVQPPVTVTKDARGGGTWTVDIYIGDDKTPSGTTFEIMAIANPKEKMAEGHKLTEWPKAKDVKWKSNVIKVVRQ